MSSSKQEQPLVPTGQQTPWLTRAWIGVALVPVFFFVAFAVGEGLYSMLGYEAGTAEAPGWTIAVVSAVTLAVVVVPCFFAIHYGRRAMKAGDLRGRVPLIIGWVVAAGWFVLTVVSEVGDFVRR
ncbi:hypothetical protein FHX52_0504 [Humibacillus xanthopallidus]|uniref:Uncharacterized protein n=1 Tax=Humibacillus xanthopallidus TaxID=412689 RepID=A0A543PTJ5_9MICO|nr:hypothetical protein [Humibacillus xanthopallidus]TQN47408.1 hypothetical protein FHX52_0504 [Humibacillus xanthopallidus]